MSNCDPENKYETVTACLQDHLDQQYPNCSLAQFLQYRCSAADHLSRLAHFGAPKLEGYGYLQGTTGCQLPCRRKIYPVTPVSETQSRLINPIFANHSGFYVTYFPATEISKKTEVEAYGPSIFLTNIGGNMGLFLGLSIWSIFQFGMERAHGTLHRLMGKERKGY